MINNKRTLKLLLPFFLLLTLCGNALAVPPQTISYQAYLKDSASGLPINTTENVTFRIYNIDIGGVALWTETQSVTITDGLFSVELGSGASPLPKAFMDNPLWLGVEISADGEASPRKALTSVNNAFRAEDSDTLEGLSAASLDQSAHVTDTANPHVVTAAQIGATSAADITTEIDTHTGDGSAHHAKTSSFVELSGQATDTQIPALIARDSEIMSTVLASDGSNSGLNADLLDGLSASSFMSSTADNWVNTTGDTMTGKLTLTSSSEVFKINSAGSSSWLRWQENSTDRGFIGYSSGNTLWGGGVEILDAFLMKGNTALQLGDSSLVMTIDNNNVGIGTTNPQTRLEVVGDGTSWEKGFISIKNIAEDAGIRLFDSESTVRFHIFNDNAAGDELRIAPEDSYINGGITIEQSGHTGVGTVNPNSTLHVNGDGVVPSFRAQVSGGTKFIVAANGGVAVGSNVSVPDTRLQVVGGSDATLIAGSGYAQIGYATGENIVIDTNEIMARNNGVKSKLYLNKDSSYVVVPGLEITGGADLVEPFDVVSDGLDDLIVPGMVVSINPEQPGKLKVAKGAYDRTVAGIISGANGINPGLSMAQQNSIADGSHPVALTGRLYALADASYGAIKPGDMLTTSDTTGHVMKVTDHNRAQGAIIGKAMTPLESGKGHVLVLVTLQ